MANWASKATEQRTAQPRREVKLRQRPFPKELAPWRYRTQAGPLVSEKTYAVLLFLLLLVSCNIGSINNIVALRSSDGTNYVGLRDVVFLVVIVTALPFLAQRHKGLSRHP